MVQTDCIPGLLCPAQFPSNAKSSGLDLYHANRRAAPEVGTFPPWSSGVLSGVTKVRVVSFLLGLTLASLIMASYILTLDRKQLLLSPEPFHPSPKVTPSNPPPEKSSESDGIDINMLVNMITSKLEFRPRKVPEVSDVIATDSHLFSVLPPQFLSNIKSPCWQEEFSAKTQVDPYGRNMFALYSKSFQTVVERLQSRFQALFNRDHRVRRRRLRCLPYFYIIGQPKCGTTDLYQRLLLHPVVSFNVMKETHWWTRKRFGFIRFKDGLKERFPVQDYLDLFDSTAYHIQEGLLGNTSADHRNQLITGEASASTMWDNQAWGYLHDDMRDVEPPFLTQDFIHAVQPNAKIIIMLRDPAERLYSDYLYFKMANKSVEDFHQRVLESVLLFQSCLKENSLRSCVYGVNLSKAMPVRLNLGVYFVLLLDWLSVFRNEQILVLRLEDYGANLKPTMQKVFNFLDLGPLLPSREAMVTKRQVSNTRRAADKRLGPMLPATRGLLRDFHRPFNHKLALVLDDQAFHWEDT
ncbi:carbohydrate sulfotransferase 15-like [Aplochiton taeniatus]